MHNRTIVSQLFHINVARITHRDKMQENTHKATECGRLAKKVCASSGQMAFSVFSVQIYCIKIQKIVKKLTSEPDVTFG